MSLLKTIFTWWNGATAGIHFTIAKRGVFVGQDEFGARYYEAKDASDSYDGRKRRWVIFNGYAEASKVPPDWHGWLHHTTDTLPPQGGLPRKAWQKDHVRNLSGTDLAYRPPGSTLVSGGDKPKPAYEAWRPS